MQLLEWPACPAVDGGGGNMSICVPPIGCSSDLWITLAVVFQMGSRVAAAVRGRPVGVTCCRLLGLAPGGPREHNSGLELEVECPLILWTVGIPTHSLQEPPRTLVHLKKLAVDGKPFC